MTTNIPRAESGAKENERSTIATNGDLDVPDGAVVRESIRAEGELRVGVGAIVKGSATSGRGAKVSEGARISGGLFVDGTLLWGDSAHADRAVIRGPLVTGGGTTRASGLHATGGIHPAERTEVNK